MAVSVVNSTSARIDGALIKRSVEAALKHQRMSGDVSVAIVGDQRMRRLNRTYRGKDRVTDILSFAEEGAGMGEQGFLGELVIDYAVIKKQAKRFAPSVRWELAFIVIHGTLHLLGYEDESEAGAAEMERLGHIIIKKVL